MSVRVSICIPLYNGARYLRQCIDSCLSQTFSDYEIVICDDGSTDEGPAIVTEFMKTTDRIRFFRNDQNLGLSGNWNRCIRESRGEWIKFIFQDDYMERHCLQEFMAATTGDTVLLVSRRHFIFDYEPSAAERRDYERKSRLFDKWSGGAVDRFPARRIARYAARHMSINFIGEPSLTMFSKALAVKAGGFADGFIQLCDLDFLLRLASINGITYIPEKLCSFRLHHSTTTSTNIADRYYRLRFLEPVKLGARMLGESAYEPLRARWNGFHYFMARLFVNARMAEAASAARTADQLLALKEFAGDPLISREARPSPVHRVIVLGLLLKRKIAHLRRS